MAWHRGSWWPLYVREWYAPRSSQHMFDPYSFCLVVVGLLLHLLWGTDHIDTWGYGFLAAVIAELGHKVVINSQLVLRQIRNNSGTSGEYIGKETEFSPSSLGVKDSSSYIIISPTIVKSKCVCMYHHHHLSAGDSVQNILGDVLSCALGYILGTLFLALDLWWLSLVWVAVSEVTKFHEISLTALVTIRPLIGGRWRAWPTCGTAW